MLNRDISDKKLQMDSLDGLRGFAALIVVFSHTSNSDMFFLPFLDLSGIGKSGVFLFFLLSSFLLTLPLLRKGKDILTFPVMSHYWQRRFFRIYPLYTLYLLGGVISTWFITTFFNIEGLGIPFALDWHSFLNHITLQEGQGVTWSIAVEFKFYFILPILVMAIGFVRRYGLVTIILFLLALLLASQIISPQNQSLENDSRILPYMPIFIIGILLAILQDYTNRYSGKVKYVTSIYRYLGYVGVAGVIFMTPVIYSMLVKNIPNNYFHKQFIFFAIFWSFILLSSVNVKGFIQRFFSLPIFRFYGALSFSLYLFHPIFIGALNRLELNGYISAWLVLLISTGAAYISFRILEKPVSKLKFDRNLMSSISQITGRYKRTK